MIYDDIAELYDLFANTDYDVDFFCGEIEANGTRVLELTSGTGRLSIPLIEAGADLTCVDISQSMLAMLSDKLRERELSARLICSDIEQMSFDSEFDLAIFPFQTFMELVGRQKQRNVLRAIYRSLANDANFICTLHNPELRRHSVDGILRIVGRFPKETGSLIVSGFEQGGDPVVTRRQFFEYYNESGLLEWKRLMTLEFELIEKETFQEMAGGAGFKVAALYGNYDRSEFDPRHSPFMIWVLETD